MSYEDWVMSGLVYKQQDETIWIQRHATFDPFWWLGRCARLEEGTDALGDVSITQRRNPRGGVERDGVVTGSPGESTTTLTMKRLQADRKKTDLKHCFWNVDQRIQCSGIDADAWNSWTEIIRYCYGKATERGIPGTAYDGDNEEQVVGFPWKSLYTDDLYRVTGEIGDPLGSMGTPVLSRLLDVDSCQPGRCPGECDNQEDCVVVAISETDATNSHLATSLYGGDLDSWTDPPVALAWAAPTTADPINILCIGSFLVVTSQDDKAIIYSDDRGTTQVRVTTTDMTTNGANYVDGLDQAFLVVTGNAGYIYGSYDAARTWETLDAGNATGLNLGRVMIARDNPLVIYAVSNEDDAIVKSENGGRTWYALTTAMTVGLYTALWVNDQNHVLVGTSVGELFETSNGGTNWTEQTLLPGITAAHKGNMSIADIVGCGCGVLALITENSSDDERKFYRNVDNGSDGKWYEPDEYETVASGKSLMGLTCCSANHFIAVGGYSGAPSDDLALLLR